MYILVEILHTEFQYISLIKCKSIIEIEKQLRKEEQKNGGCARHVALAAHFVPIGVRLPEPGQKGTLLSRPGVPGWETGTTEIFQPGQISVSVVVVSSTTRVRFYLLF